MNKVYPYLFRPAFKDYVWGGRMLEKLFARPLPPGKVAESWEIAAHPAGVSTVINGPLAGMTLVELHEELGLELIGTASAWAQEQGKFPLLIKLLDAQERLSVQVHPGDAYARLQHDRELGKTEMWLVLHAEPGAAVILGVAEGTTPDAFRKAISDGRLDSFLHRLPVTAGDFICVPSGSLHAILGGLVIAEIQQNSNATYRVYDWGRNEPDRPLHIDQAMDVINFEQVTPKLHEAEALEAGQGLRRERLCRNQYFTVERWTVSPGVSWHGRCDGSTMEIWGTIEGHANLSAAGYQVSLPAVRFVLLPATIGEFAFAAQETAMLLRVFTEHSLSPIK